MSDTTTYGSISNIISHRAKDLCPNWVTGWAVEYLFWMDWVPFFIFLINVIAGYWSWDFFFWFMNIILSMDWLVNMAMVRAFDVPSIQGPHCIYGPSFPSYTTDILFAYFGALKCLSLLRRMPPLNQYNMFYCFLLVYLSVMERVWRLINSPEDMIAGCITGFAMAFVSVLILELVFRPLSPYIEKLWIYRWCGITNFYFDKERPYASYSIVHGTIVNNSPNEVI